MSSQSAAVHVHEPVLRSGFKHLSERRAPVRVIAKVASERQHRIARQPRVASPVEFPELRDCRSKTCVARITAADDDLEIVEVVMVAQHQGGTRMGGYVNFNVHRLDTMRDLGAGPGRSSTRSLG